MKRKILIRVLTALSVIILLFGYGVYHFFYSMNSLPKGEFLCESTSPQGTYTVKLYVSITALSSDAIRGELINNETGKSKNIYWEYSRYIRRYNEITWESDNVVIINGKMLNVKKDIYDFRRK